MAKKKVKALPTRKAMHDAIYPALDKAGRAVMDAKNATKLELQEAAEEIRGAIEAVKENRITEQKFRELVNGWAGAGGSTIGEMQGSAGKALQALIE